MDVATLHIRNVPAELLDELRGWADASNRSINAEVIDVIRREADRRRQQSDFARLLAEYYEKYGDQPVESNVVAMLREDRDRGHKPEFGY